MQRKMVHYCIFYLWQDDLPDPVMTRKRATRKMNWGIQVAHDPHFIGYDFLLELESISVDEFISEWEWLEKNQPESYEEVPSL